MTEIASSSLFDRIAAVCRDLGVPAWLLERVLREERMTIRRIGNARAWTDADVEALRGMGFRTTADGHDLNRDHLKLVTPEALSPHLGPRILDEVEYVALDG